MISRVWDHVISTDAADAKEKASLGQFLMGLKHLTDAEEIVSLGQFFMGLKPILQQRNKLCRCRSLPMVKWTYSFLCEQG